MPQQGTVSSLCDIMAGCDVDDAWRWRRLCCSVLHWALPGTHPVSHVQHNVLPGPQGALPQESRTVRHAQSDRVGHGMLWMHGESSTIRLCMTRLVPCFCVVSCFLLFPIDPY